MWRRCRLGSAVALAFVACVLAAVVVSTSVATPRPGRAPSARLATPTTASHRRDAIVDAKHLLTGVKAPAGAVVRSSGTGIGPRAHLLTLAFASAVAYRTWTVPEDPAAVLSFVAENLPAGSTVVSSGSGGPNPISRSTIYSWPPVAGVLDVRWLEVQVTSRAGGGTLLYAKSQSQWVVARPPTEQIPAGVRDVEVTDGLPGKRPFLSDRVTGRAKVRALVARFDSLAIVQPGAINCPSETVRPIVTVAFRGGVFDQTLAVARVSSTANLPWPADVPGWSCFPVSFNVRGHDQPALAGNVIKPIQRLLHIRLVSRR